MQALAYGGGDCWVEVVGFSVGERRGGERGDFMARRENLHAGFMQAFAYGGGDCWVEVVGFSRGEGQGGESGDIMARREDLH